MTLNAANHPWVARHILIEITDLSTAWIPEFPKLFLFFFFFFLLCGL
uniref:Uncharacterized protein n=1 Tax=Rhizophora mucronata TaxID=61149 RepID=A0A2P2QTR2_RHIMU